MDLFSCRKHEDYDLDLFPTGIRPTPLYISEDHGRLKDLTSNHLFTSITPFYPTSPISYCPLHLFMRSSGVLGGLADPSVGGAHIHMGQLPLEEA